MARYQDITGQKFNFLTAKSYAGATEKGAARWLCVCDCGGEKEVNATELKRGNTKSCGCKAADARQAAGKVRSAGLIYSRANKPRERKSWENMLARCYSPTNNLYHRYGARGIAVCAQWRQSFKTFFDDMGDRPAGTTLDRINNDLGYSPANCRWADVTTQANNRCTNHWITIDGEAKTISQWANCKGVNPFLIHTRLYKGWSEHDAVTLPKGSIRP